MQACMCTATSFTVELKTDGLQDAKVMLEDEADINASIIIGQDTKIKVVSKFHLGELLMSRWSDGSSREQQSSRRTQMQRQSH